jgi:hypothetical protein
MFQKLAFMELTHPIYIRSNKIIIDDEIESVFGDYQYSVKENIEWRSQVYQAV